MRTSASLASLFALSLVACAGEIDGGGGGGDDDTGVVCGDGVQDTTEACDDGNGLDGDGCSSSCVVEAVPRVEVSFDKPSVTTDLLVDNEVTVTVTGVDGFSGPVTLTTSVVDAGGAAISDWAATLSTTTLTIPQDGSQTAKLTLFIPGETPALSGTIKVSASSAAAPVESSLAVTANPQATITYTTQGNECVYPARFNIATPVTIKVGRKLRVVDAGALKMQIHFDGGIAGISHQDAPMDAGAAYEQTPTAPSGGANVTFYCHNANQPGVVAVEAPNSTNLRQRLVVVE